MQRAVERRSPSIRLSWTSLSASRRVCASLMAGSGQYLFFQFMKGHIFLLFFIYFEIGIGGSHHGDGRGRRQKRHGPYTPSRRILAGNTVCQRVYSPCLSRKSAVGGAGFRKRRVATHRAGRPMRSEPMSLWLFFLSVGRWLRVEAGGRRAGCRAFPSFPCTG